MTMNEQLYRIETDAFVAGFTADGDVIQAMAPILKRIIGGWTLPQIAEYCRFKRWGLMRCDGGLIWEVLKDGMVYPDKEE
jgi:hypothetical protein